MMQNTENDDVFPDTGRGYDLKHEKFGFCVAIVVLSTMTGSVVGTIWAFAVEAKVLWGIILGILINVIVWGFVGYTATAKGHSPYRKAIATLGILVWPVNIPVGILGLAVWFIRAAAKHQLERERPMMKLIETIKAIFKSTDNG